MFGPAGRGRGRHTILPAWMTKGSDTAAAPAPAANVQPPSASSIASTNAAPEAEHRSRFGPRGVAAPILPSSGIADRKPSNHGVDGAKEAGKSSRFADRPLKNVDEPRRANGHSRLPPRSSSSSRSRSSAANYTRKRCRRGSSPSRSRSQSPYARGARSRCRKKSRSPQRRRRSPSRSPGRGRSPSRNNRSRSPYRRKSRYIRRSRSARRSPSPGHPQSRKSRAIVERDDDSAYRKPLSPRCRSYSRDKRSCSPPPELTAAELCDRLLKLRNVPWKEREVLIDDFINCFNTGNDFYSEDPDGRALPFKRLLKRFFLDGPDMVEVTRRLCFTDSSTHSFCLAYERDEDTDQIVLYECRNSRIVRVYLFRDEKGYVSDKTAVSLSQIKDTSVYRQVFKYVCKKGIRPDAKPEYFDYVKDSCTD